MTHIEFKRIWLPLNPVFYRTAWSVLGNENDAKDAVQELYIKLWNSRNSLDGIRNPSAYGATLIRNMSLDMLRRKDGKMNDRLDGSENQIAIEDNDETAEATAERVRRLYKALETFEKSDRDLIRMRFFEDMEYEDIAARTGLSEGNIRVRISRARQKIKAMLMNGVNM